MTKNDSMGVSTEPTSPLESKTASGRERRVGTFTFGIVLVVAGIAMMAALFFPSLDLRLLLKLSPAVLILLGAEVLLSTRKGGRIKYDWLGMLLCFVLVMLALAAFFITWAMVHFPDEVRLYW
jgi:membrane associated rhomboid family serine protease